VLHNNLSYQLSKLGISQIITEVNGGKLRHTIKKVGPAVSYALSPDGQVLATGSYYHEIKLWNLKTGKLLRTLAGNSHEVDALAISPDGKTLASGGRFGGPSLAPAPGYVAPKDIPCRASANGCEEIKLWDLDTGKLRKTIRGDSGGVKSLAFSPDGKMLATSSKKIKLWDLDTGKLLRSLNEESNARSIAFSPDGKTLATGDYNGTILLWDLKTKNPPRIMSGNEAPSLFVAFSPDGKMLASSGSSGGAIKIWNLQTQDLPQTIEGNSYQVSALAFSPDSQTIAAGGSDKTIKLWQVVP
jgi:WD40 repeat protein